MPVQVGCQALRNIAREFPHVHILAVAHCKKSSPDERFDGILGSTALRGETDTTFVIYEESGQRVIAVETRVGRPFNPSILRAETAENAGASLVRDFGLNGTFDEWKAVQSESSQKHESKNYADRVMAYLENCEGRTSSQSLILTNVGGKTQKVTDAIRALESDGV